MSEQCVVISGIKSCREIEKTKTGCLLWAYSINKMLVNVEQSSFSGVVLNVSRLMGIKKIIGSKVFSKSRFNNTFDDFRYERQTRNRTIVWELVLYFPSWSWVIEPSRLLQPNSWTACLPGWFAVVLSAPTETLSVPAVLTRCCTVTVTQLCYCDTLSGPSSGSSYLGHYINYRLINWLTNGTAQESTFKPINDEINNRIIQPKITTALKTDDRGCGWMN